MELSPFAVYLIKTGQLFCAALGMKDEDMLSEQQFGNSLEPRVGDEEVIRELNGVELESAIVSWSASAYVNHNTRHKQWNGPTQKLVLDVLSQLQKLQFWHLANWIDGTGRETNQFWGIRRVNGTPVWVTREPNQQEKLHEGIQKLHEELGINILAM